MFYKNKNKNQIIIWSITIILFLAVFLNIQNVQKVLAAEITSDELIELTNQSRTEQEIEKLTVNQNLISAAASKARDMFEHNYFAHTSSKGISPWDWIRQAGYSYQYAGENLAMDFVTAEATHKALIASATHRKNILNPNYKEIGIAVLSGNFEKRQTTIIVQMFGATAFIKKQKSTINSVESSIAKKSVVASAETKANNSPVTEVNLARSSLDENSIELNKSNEKESVRKIAVLPIELNNNELISEQKEKLCGDPVLFTKRIENEVIPLNFSQNFEFFCYNKNKPVNLTTFLELNWNGRIKNTFENNNDDFVAQRNNNKFVLAYNSLKEIIKEIPKYLSCFLFGGKIERLCGMIKSVE